MLWTLGQRSSVLDFRRARFRHDSLILTTLRPVRRNITNSHQIQKSQHFPYLGQTGEAYECHITNVVHYYDSYSPSESEVTRKEITEYVKSITGCLTGAMWFFEKMFTCLPRPFFGLTWRNECRASVLYRVEKPRSFHH